MLREANVTVETLGMQSALDFSTALFRLCRLLRELRPDVVQGWMYHGDLIGGLAARWTRQGRVVWGVRASNLVAGTPLTTLIARWLCARLSSRVPDVIICAAESGRRVHVAIGYDAARTCVIANGFDVDDALPSPAHSTTVRAALGLHPDELVVGLVGRFHPIKDIHNFVRAAGILVQRTPGIRFLMVGRGFEPANLELMQWIEQNGVRENMLLVGERSDISRCLAALDVFALSSRAEGFPNVVGEAMAVGVPCVVTDVGDAARLVGDTGRVVAPQDPTALADGIAELLALSHDERVAAGLRARARIRDEFSLARASARYNAVYAGLLARPEAA